MKFFCITPDDITELRWTASPTMETYADILQAQIAAGLARGQVLPLPPPWQRFSLSVAQHGGGVVVQVLDTMLLPVLTIAVAMHKSHGQPLWRVLTALVPHQSRTHNAPTPERRWCAHVWHGTPYPYDSDEPWSLLIQAVAQGWFDKRRSRSAQATSVEAARTSL